MWYKQPGQLKQFQLLSDWSSEATCSHPRCQHLPPLNLLSLQRHQQLAHSEGVQDTFSFLSLPQNLFYNHFFLPCYLAMLISLFGTEPDAEHNYRYMKPAESQNTYSALAKTRSLDPKTQRGFTVYRMRKVSIIFLSSKKLRLFR